MKTSLSLAFTLALPLLVATSARAEDTIEAEVSCADGTSHDLSDERTLLIRDLAVVNHADASGRGAWSFGHVMASITPAGYPGGAPAYVRDWLREWEDDRVVNGVATPRVTNMRDKLIDPWPKRADGTLDLAQAPFRLLAIVDRADRYDLAAGRAGEVRFVYAAIEPPGRFPNRRLPMKFTVIVELARPVASRAELTAWTRAWAALGRLPIAGAAYHDALRALTDPVLAAGAANLIAVRSNEVTIDDPWDLRHFTPSPAAGGALRTTALAMTPMIQRNRSAALTTWLYEVASRADVLLGRHRLPATFRGVALRGNYAPMTMVKEGKASFVWRTDGTRGSTDDENELRHRFSLFTCSGCHSGETNTKAVHITPRRADEVSTLSTFMTGGRVKDLVRPSVVRRFDDLGRRRRAMAALVCGLDARDEDRSFDE